MNNAAKVVVFLSASRAFFPLLEKFADEKKPAEVDVVVTKGATASTYLSDFEGEIWELNAESFSAEALSKEKEQQIKQKGYEKAIILCNEVGQPGYSNVEKLAKKTGVKEIIYFDPLQNSRRAGLGNKIRVWLRMRGEYLLEMLLLLGLFVLYIFYAIPKKILTKQMN